MTSHRQLSVFFCLYHYAWSSDVAFGEVVTLCDTLINQECIEVAAHAKNLSAPIVGISFGLEVSGKAVDVRPQWPASEVDESSSLFEPVLKTGLVEELS